LSAQGVQVEGDPNDGFTETHQVVIRVKPFGGGQEIARRLEENNIITNYQALPDDQTFLESSGIRMGVQEMTRFGMAEKDFAVLAGLIAEVIIKNKKAKEEVKKFRQNFLRMKYCLPMKQALPLASKMMRSIVHDPDFADQFMESMEKRVS